jgi:membrane associated rhomboid family serine protease
MKKTPFTFFHEFDLVFTREQTKSRFGFKWWWLKGFAHIGVLKVLEEAGLKLIILEQVWGLLLGGFMHQDIPHLN